MRPIPIVAAIVLSAACSSTESSGPSSLAERGEAAAGGTAPAVDAPDGAQAVEVGSVGVGFAVPEAYVILDPTEHAADDYASDWFADLAESVDVPADQLTTAMRSNLELFLFAPPGVDGFSDHLTVEWRPSEEPPTRDELIREAEPLGFTDIVVSTAPVDGVEVVDAAYRDPERGRAGYDVYVGRGDGVVVLSLSASDAATAEQVGEVVVESLEVAG